MAQYPSYKDSGFDWIGQIPSHWGAIKNKFLFRESDERNGDESYRLLSFSKSKGIIPFDENSEKESSSESLKNYKILHKGQLLENRLQAWNGMFLDSSIEGCVSPDYSVFTLLDEKSNIRFFSYLFRTNLYIEQWANASKGIGSGFNRLYTPQFGSVIALFPPKEEQDAIVAYLDAVTAKIDEAIAQQQRMIDLLNERKIIIISKAVTIGLGGECETKDSGVSWIGSINRGWDLYKLKFLLSEHLMYGANESAESENESYPRYIRITDIDEDGNLKPDTFVSLSPTKAAPYLLKKGDILFARSGATAGKTFLFKEDTQACFAGYLIKASLGDRLLPEYLSYYTSSGIYDNWKNSIFIQATIPNIGAEKYGMLQIPLPSVDEQKMIIDYLDKEVGKLMTAIGDFKRKISLLQERKQIIINDVVTGKVKVV